MVLGRSGVLAGRVVEPELQPCRAEQSVTDGVAAVAVLQVPVPFRFDRAQHPRERHQWTDVCVVDPFVEPGLAARRWSGTRPGTAGADHRRTSTGRRARPTRPPAADRSARSVRTPTSRSRVAAAVVRAVLRGSGPTGGRRLRGSRFDSWSPLQCASRPPDSQRRAPVTVGFYGRSLHLVRYRRPQPPVASGRPGA